ncbi:MAG: hypothetical protein IT381_24810 [Deltaproteobacteria bacterium]|nr:hypothetical protein [Deltaproteobacteria bacterium]
MSSSISVGSRVRVQLRPPISYCNQFAGMAGIVKAFIENNQAVVLFDTGTEHPVPIACLELLS